jgi:hypothetical protein
MRAPIRYHDSAERSSPGLIEHAYLSIPRISGPFGPVCGAGRDFTLMLMNTCVGYRRTTREPYDRAEWQADDAGGDMG